MQMYTILKYTILGFVCLLVRLICELCLRIGEITSYDINGRFCRRFSLMAVDKLKYMYLP